jgi:uncharacterized protein YjbJ (UPF0337 family)
LVSFVPSWFSFLALRSPGAGARNESRDAAFSVHCNVNPFGDSLMDKNRIDGAAKEIKGGAKEAFGKVTGNTGKQMAGMAEKKIGTAQRKMGEAMDKARTAPR